MLEGLGVIYCWNGDPAFLSSSPIFSPSSSFFSFFFTTVFTPSHSHRVAGCGINGGVQLRGVKQLVKKQLRDTLPTRPEPVEAARPTVACRSTSAHRHLQHPPLHLPHPQMEQIIQLLWVKQGYIHFWGERKEVKRWREASGLLFAFSGSH